MREDDDGLRLRAFKSPGNITGEQNQSRAGEHDGDDSHEGSARVPEDVPVSQFEILERDHGGEAAGPFPFRPVVCTSVPSRIVKC